MPNVSMSKDFLFIAYASHTLYLDRYLGSLGPSYSLDLSFHMCAEANAGDLLSYRLSLTD